MPPFRQRPRLLVWTLSKQRQDKDINLKFINLKIFTNNNNAKAKSLPMPN